MFTGIIEEIGKVLRVDKDRLTIGCKKILSDINIGDSIAVNGVCLTADIIGDDCFTAYVMGETMRRTNLSGLKIASEVNLERAMALNGRFGGHIVSGHVDGIGNILSYDKEKEALWVTIGADESILRYIVEKGSVSIDGISLTVAYVDDKCFKVSIIPHTQQETTLTSKKRGDVVNLECDMIGKYVEKFLGKNKKSSKITMEFLAQNGF